MPRFPRNARIVLAADMSDADSVETNCVTTKAAGIQSSHLGIDLVTAGDCQHDTEKHMPRIRQMNAEDNRFVANLFDLGEDIAVHCPYRRRIGP